MQEIIPYFLPPCKGGPEISNGLLFAEPSCYNDCIPAVPVLRPARLRRRPEAGAGRKKPQKDGFHLIAATTANYLAVGAACLAALGLLAFIIQRNRVMARADKAAFLLTVLAVGVSILAEVGTDFLENGGPALRVPNILCNLVGFACSPLTSMTAMPFFP